ncbi:TonB-dependent receptor [Tenacibaculum soleae]|uniref:TonB-dependent receptor n=1 Tax=Tenacibaculum soleae TaxID=447689 RepID=UPI0026E1A306|nr:TonB-dependent receptor [Tenacibaculum soleae]MDO6813390.1 TonB-dependent receptor [Tenacibaculum soleae]
MKNTLFIILFFNFATVLPQQNTEKISITFNNLNKKECLNLIESKTDYHFYYIEEWFDKKRIDTSFTNSKISEILNFIFKDSPINYFILDSSKIILTNGNLIKKTVYETSKNTNRSPVFVNLKNNNKNLIKIGKESNLKQKKYLLTGFIKNNKNDSPLNNVTILEKSKNLYTTTDINGFYSLKLPYGKNKIETHIIGFNSTVKDLIIYNNGVLNLSISENSEHLDEVIIDGNLNKNIKQTISGITQIKAQNIKKIPLVLGERDLLKVAATLPGIKSSGEGSEGVNVRGGKVDQNLFLLDNATIYNPTHFLGLFSAINPFTTHSLKIYKGNTPTEYGGRLSSVFDITTKDPNTKKFKGEASIGPVTGNLNIDLPIFKNKSGLILGARSTYSDWILNTVDNDKLNNSNVSFFDLIAKYKHKINSNNNIKLTGYYSKDKYQISSDTINKYNNSSISFNWFHLFNDKNKGNLILSNSTYSFDINYENDETTKGYDLNYRINETGLKLKLKYIHSKKHSFDYGLETKLYNISPGTIVPNNNKSTITSLSIPNEKAIENGLFLSDEITLNKKLTINLGLRFSQYLALGSSKQRIYKESTPKNPSNLIEIKEYNKNEIFKKYQGLSYRLSGRYSLTNDLSLKASFNKSFQYIHRLNNNTSASPMDTWRLSDTNIKPQEGIQTTFGIFKNINGNNYEVSIEGYYKKYKNLLDYKIGANLLLNETVETEVLQGAGKSYGAEFLIKKNKGKLNGWLGYSYSKSLIQLKSDFSEETVNGGKFFPTNYDKPHDFNIVLNYKLTERYSFSSNFTYQTGRPITYPTGKYVHQGIELLTYSNRNQFRIPDYYRLDIGFNIEGNHKIKKLGHSFWNISVYNVLGRNNPYSIYFETKNGKVNGYKSSIFSTPIPTITYNFKF